MDPEDDINMFFNDEHNDEENNDDENDDVEGEARGRQKRSSWWQHYEEIIENGSKYAKCNYCPKRYKLSGKSNSTGNMKRHTLKDHSDRLLQATLEEEDFVFSQETFRRTLIEWIVLCDQPFAVVSSPAFDKLIKSLNPVAQLISDKTVQADIMSKFGEKMLEVKAQLAAIPGKISITMDGWTSKNVLSFVAIRAHWLDNDWKYQTTLLDFAKVEGEHSGYKLKTIFEDCLSRFDIPFSKIMGITVDNATNNDTFFFWLEEMGLTAEVNQIRCLAHIMNLSVQDMLKALKAPFVEEPNRDDVQDDEDDLDDEELEDIDMNKEDEIEEENEGESENDTVETANEIIVVKVRKLVKKIRKSVQMRQKLNKCCEMYHLKYLVPIIDVSTRWNSTNEMIKRAEYLRRPLRALCAQEKKLSSLQISDSQWQQLHDIQTVLAKFHRSTKLVSMERHPTIAAYIPTFDWLVSTLKKCIADNELLATAARQGLAKLEKYEPNIQKTKIPFFATILHPALKTTYFKEHGYSASTVRDYVKEFENYFSESYKHTTDDDVEPNDESESDDEFYAHMFKRSKVDKNLSEFKKYLSLPLVSVKTSSLEFWKSNQLQFPLLSQMARDILPVQSASVSVERDFSKSARVVTPDRASLTAATIRATMCVKSWLK